MTSFYSRVAYHHPTGEDVRDFFVCYIADNVKKEATTSTTTR